VIAGFTNNMTTTISGVAIILEKLFELTNGIVEILRALRC
jgi:hypothetical protein